MTVGKGIGFAIVLWLLMQVIVLPLIGWGMFGTAITPVIAGATFLLHLMYGVVLGRFVDR